MDEVTRVGKIQDYNLDISSGGVSENAAKYFLSFNYFKNEAIIIGKDLERFSGRFNLEQEPGKVVKYGLNSSFSYSIMNMGAGGGYYSDPITLAYGKMNPLIAVRNKLGEWNFENTQYNPVAQRSKDGDRSEAKTYRAILSPYVTIRFSPAWSFTSRGGLDLYSIKEFGYWSFLQPQGKGLRGMGEQGTTTRTLLSITNTLSWVKAFDDHHVNMMVGQEAQHTRENSSYLAGSNYPVEYLSKSSWRQSLRVRPLLWIMWLLRPSSLTGSMIMPTNIICRQASVPTDPPVSVPTTAGRLSIPWVHAIA